MKNFRKKYIKWVSEKEASFAISNNVRIEYLRSTYNKGELPIELPMLIPLFKWLYETSHLIDMILFWGSYAKGSEKKFTFNNYKPPCYERTLSHGPSDVDCLIVSEHKLIAPLKLSNYAILNRNLSFSQHEMLNVYRDIFIHTEEELFDLLTNSTYAPLYIYSYKVNGALIKSNRTANRIFDYFSGKSNYEKNARLLFDNKSKWFKSLIT